MIDIYGIASRKSRQIDTVVEVAKKAQLGGKRLVLFTPDQVRTATVFARYGALCAVVGTTGLVPYFRKDAL